MSREVEGVLDRIVDGETAVILVEDDELDFNVDAERLPEGAEEGVWMVLEVEGGEVVSMTLDPETTRERRERIEDKMERLRERGRESSEKVE